MKHIIYDKVHNEIVIDKDLQMNGDLSVSGIINVYMMMIHKKIIFKILVNCQKKLVLNYLI